MRGSKYHNKKTKITGGVFDSKLEAQHFTLLNRRQALGEIKGLGRQVKIRLTDKPKGRQRVYIADFVFYDIKKCSWVLWDSKGMLIEPYQTKRDWLLDKFTGFIFVEATREGFKEFTPYGQIPLHFV